MTIKNSIRLPNEIDPEVARQLKSDRHLLVSLDGEHLAALCPGGDRGVARFYHSGPARWADLAITDPRLLHVRDSDVLITGHDSEEPHGPRRYYLIDRRGQVVCSGHGPPGRNRARRRLYTNTGATRFKVQWMGLPAVVSFGRDQKWWVKNEFFELPLPGYVNLVQNSPDKSAVILLIEPVQPFDETHLPYQRLLLVRSPVSKDSLSPAMMTGSTAGLDQSMVEVFYSGHFYLLSVFWTKPYGHLVAFVDHEREADLSFDREFHQLLITPNDQRVPVPDKHKVKLVLVNQNGDLAAFVTKTGNGKENHLFDGSGNQLVSAPEIWNLAFEDNEQGFRYILIDGDTVRSVSLSL